MNINETRLRIAVAFDRLLHDLLELEAAEEGEGARRVMEASDQVASAEWEFRKDLSLRGDERALRAR